MAARRARACTTSRSHPLNSCSSGMFPEIPTSARMALAGSRARSLGACPWVPLARASRRWRTHWRTSKARGGDAGGGAAAGVGG
eukprot:15481317-Alexandrium_andersonii.AAC.1